MLPFPLPSIPRSVAAALATFFLTTSAAHSHGFVGDRFFPPTISTDDPFATDELLLPSISFFKSPGNPAAATTDFGAEFDKEIFPGCALGLSGDYLKVKPDGQPASTGWDDFTLSAKWQVWQNEQHEAIFSIGAEWSAGGTGAGRVGADSASTITPTIYFGKGFGDLPDALAYARPFAITGTVGEDFPTSSDPNNLEWGFAVEYSLSYLQSQVKDLGLPDVLKNTIPLVEFSFTTPENHGGGGTTGTIDPGFLYEFKTCQIGIEATIPANAASGHNVGVVFQVQIFIDDLWPTLFGHPLFGR